MSLQPGTRLGPYEIQSPLGAGGMGEVYRARDTRLKREVALKILPDSFAGDPDRLARFQREAEVLASLNHPNIAAIYGLEARALVLELVEGETLAERLVRGAIPVGEAIPIARQIAEALEAAHERGIIHRDLKPANIKVTPDGTVKVLDFGLAKLTETNVPNNPNASNAPTLTSPVMATGAGMLLGTAAYMSPEQARGKTVDKRTDIWAFGCVLYEMLTGRRAFPGDDVAETLAAVMKSEPEWGALPMGLSPTLTVYLERCLHKDPKQRIPDIAAMRLALEGAFDSRASPGMRTDEAVQSGWRRLLPYAVGAAVASIVVAFIAWTLWPSAALRPISRFAFDIPVEQMFRNTNRVVMAVAPDGRHIVYNTQKGLYLRPMDQLDARVIPGTEANLANPFFSPDGQTIGYWDAASSRLMHIGIKGGAPVAIGPADNPRGASWGTDGTVLFGQSGKGIFRVSANGGTPALAISLNEGEEADSPQLLPDGDSVLFSVTTATGVARWDRADIVVQSLRTGSRTLLLRGGSDARYIRTGHLIYAFGNSLRAVPFDLDRLVISGSPITLAEDVMRANAGGGLTYTATANYGVSDDGELVYVAGDASATPPRSLVWVDRDGREELLGSPSREYVYPRISPEGGRLAVDIRDQQNDIWVWDFLRETLTRLTLNPRVEMYPAWTPDGRRVLFSSSTGDGGSDLAWQTADGSRTAEQITDAGAMVHVPHSVSPDSSRAVIRVGVAPPYDLAILRFDNHNKIESLVATQFNELNGEVSPDGRWLAYESDESGQTEIYVRPFPNVDSGRWQASRGGGTRPVWARNNEELFYLATGQRRSAVMSVRIERGTAWRAGAPTTLFEGSYFYNDSDVTGRGRTYDVSPDGRRFLMLKDTTDIDDAAGPRFIVVQHWTDELKRLGPTN